MSYFKCTVKLTAAEKNAFTEKYLDFIKPPLVYRTNLIRYLKQKLLTNNLV